MSEDKKSVEEKRYAILSKESVKAYAEQSGHPDLSDDVAALLAEDVVYRLREATQNSCQFMRHAKRQRLSTEDINDALRNSDIPPIHGYSSGDSMPFRHTKEGELHFVDDGEVNLANATVSVEAIPPNTGQTTIKAHWLAVEGIQKGATQGFQGKLNGKVAKGLSDDLLVYYENMTKAILGTDEELMKFALADLRTNDKIAPLLPYFVNFVSNGVKTVSHDITQLTKLLHTVKALINNQSLYLEPRPYLNLLVEGILYCLLEPLAASINPSNDHWALRDYAARLLAQITWSWSNLVNKLRQQNIAALRKVLYDSAKPFCSHYGAVMGLVAFGIQALEDVLLPRLQSYWPHLQKVMEDVPSAAMKTDAYKVYGAILLAAELVMRAKSFRLLEEAQKSADNISSADAVVSVKMAVEASKVEPTTSTPVKVGAPDLVQLPDKESHLLGPVLELPEMKGPHKILTDIYLQMYDYFGDALSSKLPIHHVKNFYVPKKEEVFISLADEETKKTGEELLQNFLNVSENENDAKSENHSYENDDEKSERSERSSRSNSDESLGFLDDQNDMEVTTTVSNDPSQGIKLTIFKRPKIHPSPDATPDSKISPQKSDGEKTPKRRRIDSRSKVIKDSDLFERVPMEKKQFSFVFSYAGAVQSFEPKKKEWTYEEALGPNSELRKLSYKLKPYGKRKNSKQKRSKTLSHAYTGNISNTL